MSNQFRVTGMLYSKSKITEYGKNNSKKREFVIHIPNSKNPAWDEYFPFVLKGDNYVKKIEGYEKNTVLTVEAIPTGRLWINQKGEEKIFPSFNAIFISSEEIDLQNDGPPTPFAMSEAPANEVKNDLPF